MNSKYRMLGEEIQERRRQCGLTQDELSDRAGLAYSTLAKIERGAVKNPSVYTISSIALALGCTVEDLIKTKQPKQQITQDDTFIFSDINGVLVRSFQNAFVKIAVRFDITVEKVETAFLHYNDAANRGEMTPKELDAALSEHLGITGLDWEQTYYSVVEPIKIMQECLAEISKTHKVGLLSNINQGMIPHMIKVGILPDLNYECIVDSSEVGAIKPEAKIYETAEKMAGVSGDQILFIDDSRTNLMAAERLGWRVMWFDDYRPTDSVKRLKEALSM